MPLCRPLGLNIAHGEVKEEDESGAEIEPYFVKHAHQGSLFFGGFNLARCRRRRRSSSQHLGRSALLHTSCCRCISGGSGGVVMRVLEI